MICETYNVIKTVDKVNICYLLLFSDCSLIFVAGAIYMIAHKILFEVCTSYFSAYYSSIISLVVPLCFFPLESFPSYNPF